MSENSQQNSPELSSLCSNMVHAMLPSITPHKVGGAIVLFDQETHLPLTFASTAKDPEAFVFMLSQLLEDGEGIKEDDSPVQVLAPVAGEIQEKTEEVVEKVEKAIDKVEDVTGKTLPKKRITQAVTVVGVILAIFASVFLSGCTVIRYGSKVPTDNTYRLSYEDIGFASDTGCAQEWVSGNPTVDLLSAKKILKDKKIEVVEGNVLATGTALADSSNVKTGLLVVEKGFWEESKHFQVEYLSHELVHYCDLEKLGADYEISFGFSNKRWALETRAYAQNFRTKKAQGVPMSKRREAIQERLVSMRDRYWLWDIDPDQYLDETETIWLRAAGV